MKKQRNLQDKKETVTVFGETISNPQKEEGSVVFGVLLLFSGILLLLNSFGIISWEIWQDLIKFWPIILILGGLHIILGKNPISRIISFILSTIVFGTAIVYVLQTRSPEILKYIPKKVIEWSNYWEVIGK